LANFLSTETRSMITHIMPKAITTSLARFMMSNWAKVSSQVELPIERGEPGMTFGVGIGVGASVGVGVGLGVGCIGVSVGLTVGVSVGVGYGV